jgi:hypothetical protein
MHAVDWYPAVVNLTGASIDRKLAPDRARHLARSHPFGFTHQRRCSRWWSHHRNALEESQKGQSQEVKPSWLQ